MDYENILCLSAQEGNLECYHFLKTFFPYLKECKVEDFAKANIHTDQSCSTSSILDNEKNIIIIECINYWKKILANPKASLIFLIDKNQLDQTKETLKERPGDFLIRPFSNDELVTRVNLIASRIGQKSNKKNISLNSITSKLTCNGKDSQTLTLRELQIVNYLINNLENGCHINEFLNNVWKDSSVGAKTVAVHFSNLRKKLSTINVGIHYNAETKKYRMLVLNPDKF